MPRAPRHLILMGNLWRFKPSTPMRAAGFEFLTLGEGVVVDGVRMPAPADIDRANEINAEWDLVRLGSPKLTPRSKGFVYFLSTEHFVKIGFSTKPFGRASALKTGLAEEIESFVLIKGTKALEAALHRQFGGARASGEWFRKTDRLRDVVAKAASGLLHLEEPL
jgi:hypothetical protein